MRAQRAGELVWLLDNVLPAPRDDHSLREPNDHILRLIRVKHPHRLAEVYQTLMHKKPELSSWLVVKAIVASNLPRARKSALLELGATNKDLNHRYPALEMLRHLDDTLFRKHLLRTLKGIPEDIKFVPDATPPEIWVIALIRKTDDRDCWNTLAELTRRASPTARHHLISGAGYDLIDSDNGYAFVPWFFGANKDYPGHRDYLRYLLGFLDDSEVGENGWQGPQMVRDQATIQLDWALKPSAVYWVKSPRSPREISLLRDIVREAAERELARSPKRP
jgi:hypothetical protein